MRHIVISDVEYESELAYSGLQQVCQPLLDHIDELPPPQQSALMMVLGRSDGAAPDRLRVALAVLADTG